MSQGLSVKLPLFIDEVDGAYALNKELNDMVQQNMKMIILTSPGERIMDAGFGVGIRNFLFEQNSVATLTTIRSRIIDQIQKYLPYVEILNVSVGSPAAQTGIPGAIDKTIINIQINYTVPAANIVSNLAFPVEI